jgi:hypothetical protein
MAGHKQGVPVQHLQFVALNRSKVGRARHFINLAGTIARRMRSPLASWRWELAKHRVPRKGKSSEPESAFQESAVVFAGY